MANRKRNIQMKFYVTEDEKRLIDEKMSQLPTRRYGAYLRKMAIDGYIIYESEIILFEAAARECKRLGAVPLPATERMQTEMDEFNARKAALKAELQKAKREEQDYAAMRRNVEDFLSPPQPEQERKKNVELE